jgi:hypothetical protein
MMGMMVRVQRARCLHDDVRGDVEPEMTVAHVCYVAAKVYWEKERKPDS